MVADVRRVVLSHADNDHAGGLAAVRAASVLPLTQTFHDITTQVEGEAALPPEQRSVQYHLVTPDLFAALGIPLRAGRGFDARDHAGDEADRTIIVNEAFAERYLRGKEPLGRRVRLGAAEDAPWRGIVGVVASVRHGGLSVEPEPQVYLPHAQATARSMQLVV